MQLRRVQPTDHAELYASFLLLVIILFLLVKKNFEDIFLFSDLHLNDKLIQEANNVYN